MEISKLQKIIDNSKYLVVFTGAGVGTDSGLRDFRGKNGLYKEKLNYDPEYYLSSDCFYHDNEEFYKYYINNMNFLDAKPNITHKYLAKLEKDKRLKTVITQNIDGLHQKAGSKNVLEVHGTIYKNYCLKCHKEYDVNKLFNSKKAPMCSCGGLIKPEVTLYGEQLPEAFEIAINEVMKSDTLIVMGTSLTVNPAASLVRYFHGDNLVIMNEDITMYDSLANLVIHDELKNVISKLK